MDIPELCFSLLPTPLSQAVARIGTQSELDIMKLASTLLIG